MLTYIRKAALLFGIACAISIPAAAWAQTQRPQVVILQIDSVLAADTNQGIDPHLGPMGPRLRKMFKYTTYHLVSEQNGRTEMGKMIEFEMPGGRILHIQPRSVEGNMIAMEVLLFQGEKPMLTTDLKLPNKGNLIVGGPHYEQGDLIITIAANMSPEPVAAEAMALAAAETK